MFIKSLKEATTEEAVKAAYVKRFHLKFDNPFGVDLLHPPILFEFKYKKDLENKREHARVMAQALYYAHYIRYQAENIDMPSAICLADCNQAVLHPVDEFITLIDKKFDWDRPASRPDVNLIKAIIDKDSESVVYPMQDACGVEEFAAALKYIIEDCVIPLKRLITIKNFESVYSLWMNEVAAYIDAPDLNLPWAFVQDACENVTMNCKTGTLLFETTAKVVKVAPLAYKRFWNKFERPPNKTTQKTLLASVDRLAAMDKRRYEGMFYTPEPFSSLSLEYLEKVLGPDWQDEYYIYDPCCGTGNLEMKLKRYDRLFMSTLEQNEVDYLQQEKIFPGAKIFQFDFLNDPVDKMPKKLRQILKNEKVVILMNPPFAEATSKGSVATKAGVSMNTFADKTVLGKAANELFIQFLWRCKHICPQAVVGLYSTLKFINAPSYKKFRDNYVGTVADGFVFHCKAFHGVTGNWPVSFSILLPENRITSGNYTVLNRQATVVGQKVVVAPTQYLSDWFNRPRNIKQSIPLSSALNLKQSNIGLDKLAEAAFGYSTLYGNSPMCAHACFFASAAIDNAHGSSITADNFEYVMTSLAVRKLITPTWLNNRDQFSVPNKQPSDTFFTDCTVWNLFSGHNQTSSFTAEYKGSKHFIDNQFYPCEPQLAIEFGPAGPGFQRMAEKAAPTFVYNWLNTRNLSPEAQCVLDYGKIVYQVFFQNWQNVRKQAWKIENTTPGWYQIRKALEESEIGINELEQVKEANKYLYAKLWPQVYKYGFLPPEFICE